MSRRRKHRPVSQEPTDESKPAESELPAASPAKVLSSAEPEARAEATSDKPATEAAAESTKPVEPVGTVTTDPPAALPGARPEARRATEPSAWGRALRAAKKFVLTTGVLDDLGASADAQAAASGAGNSTSGSKSPPPSNAGDAPKSASAAPAAEPERVGDAASEDGKSIGFDARHCVLPPSAATRPVPPDTAVVGHTSAVAVPEILGFLSSLQKSGTFWVWNEKESYSIRLLRGQVVSAQSDHQVPGLLLGHILVMQEAIGEEELVRFLELRPEASARIGDALRKAGLITEKGLRDAITYQAQRVFNRAYEIGEGWFRFEPIPPEEQPEQTLSVTHLLLESARTRDETEERLEGVLGDPFAD